MTLITAGARARATFTPEDEAARPYAFPTVAPYNVATASLTPTPDGTGSTIHPSVIDMVAERGSALRGYRYWMGNTPFYQENAVVEDPIILASNGGYDWKTPAGVVNPLDDAPEPAYNSDTEIMWDPDASRVVLYWRRGNGDLHAATSADGATWTKHMNRLTGIGTLSTLSPAIARVGVNQWVMFLNQYNYGTESGTLGKYTATSPLGPWTYVASSNEPKPTGYASGVWHHSVRWHGGRFLFLGTTRTGSPPAIFAASSTDGLTWTCSAPIITGATYRPTFVIDGSTAHVWYGLNMGAASWRTVYTQVPTSVWPA